MRMGFSWLSGLHSLVPPAEKDTVGREVSRLSSEETTDDTVEREVVKEEEEEEDEKERGGRGGGR